MKCRPLHSIMIHTHWREIFASDTILKKGSPPLNNLETSQYLLPFSFLLVWNSTRQFNIFMTGKQQPFNINTHFLPCLPSAECDWHTAAQDPGKQSIKSTTIELETNSKLKPWEVCGTWLLGGTLCLICLQSISLMLTVHIPDANSQYPCC